MIASHLASLAAFERNYLAWVKLTISCMVISGALLLRLHVSKQSINYALKSEMILVDLDQRESGQDARI